LEYGQLKKGEYTCDFWDNENRIWQRS